MHVLITAMGQRTERWTDLFDVLGDRPGVEVTVLAADVSALTEVKLDRQARRNPRRRHHLVPHLFGEGRTGHMAAAMFGPGTGRLLTGERPDVVHVIGEAAYLSTWQALRMRRRLWPDTPVTLYAARNVVMRFPPPFPMLERRAYAAVDHVFPITPAALRVIRARGYRGPATIVPPGVDSTLFRPRPRRHPRRFTAGFVGRFEEHKGIGDLLRAAEWADCDLLLIGDGALMPAIRRAAGHRPGRITVRGWAGHDELPDLLSRMDVLVLPSVEVVQRNLVPWTGIAPREQSGRVLVEAMACGVPVVGSDVGEIPQVIGAAGSVFPAGDAVALADRLVRLRDQPGLAGRCSELGIRRVAAEFSWDRIADAMCRTWERLTRPVPAGAAADVVAAGTGQTVPLPVPQLTNSTDRQATR
jgi:glycosyltransferase involved in cell wall biosynthesis